jgi:hypothetical protein
VVTLPTYNATLVQVLQAVPSVLSQARPGTT